MCLCRFCRKMKYRELVIKSAVREAADFFAMYMKKDPVDLFRVDFIRKVRYTVTVQSYADLFQEDACIQMELQILRHKNGGTE